MKQTRRTILRTSSAVIAGLAGVGTASASGHPDWDETTVYTAGDRVRHNGHVWEAQWWTRGTEPAQSTAVWERTDSASTDPSWVESGVYVAGDRVTHNGHVWEAQWWTQGTEPTKSAAVWTQVARADKRNNTGGKTDNNDTSNTDNNDTSNTDNNDTSNTDNTDSTSGDKNTSSGSGATVFAPYDHMTTASGTTLVDHASWAGTDSFVLAFVLDDGAGNAAWDGSVRIGEAGFAAEITALQKQGGTAIVSFGGAVGTPLAHTHSDPAALKDEYASVIDTYGVSQLDFDIETKNKAAVETRNKALAMLKEEYPDVSVSVTLRVRTTGLTSHGKYVVENAKEHGVALDYVNVMTMNYGWVPPHAKQVKSSANGLHDNLTAIYPQKSDAELWQMVGITPMIGVNNAGGTFRLQDAQEIADWASAKNLGYVGFWSIDRDNGNCPNGQVSPTCSGIPQDSYEFSSIFSGVN